MLGSFLLESDSHIIKIVANWRITNNSYCKLNTKTGVNWNSFDKKTNFIMKNNRRLRVRVRDALFLVRIR